MELAFFLFFATIAIASGIGMILQRNPIYCVLLLITVMVSLAGLFLMLHAQFVAIIQIVVYAGAIMVLFLFVVMLLNLSRESGDSLKLQKPVATILVISLFVPLSSMLMSNPTVEANTDSPLGLGEVEQIGQLLFTKYLLPVELAAVLLLIAIVGAVVLTRKGTVTTKE